MAKSVYKILQFQSVTCLQNFSETLVGYHALEGEEEPTKCDIAYIHV
jgi:hypothetical protein